MATYPVTPRGLTGIRHDKSRLLVRLALKNGWTVRVSGGSHYALRSPTGQLVIMSGTNRDERGYLNFRAEMRRKGLAA